jgi:DNA-binding CsgD family transcriptional regulator
MLNRRHLQFDRARGVESASLAGSASDLTVGFLLEEMLQAFDLVGAGLGIVDLDGRLLHSNALAEEILARRDGLEMTPSRILRTGPRNGAITHGLFEQLADADAPDAREREQVAIVAVPRPSGKRPLTLLVRFLAKSSSRPDPSGPLTLVFMIDPEVPVKGIEKHVRQVYGLTPAETELATLLMQGDSLAECCRQMGIRRPTAASHLRQLFNKTEARTQSQLVSVLFRRFGLFRSEVGPRKPDVAALATPLLKFPVLVSDRGSESFADSFIRR